MKLKGLGMNVTEEWMEKVRRNQKLTEFSDMVKQQNHLKFQQQEKPKEKQRQITKNELMK
ncbi:MAG: hypothetical protein ACK56F_14475 [bacterium]